MSHYDISTLAIPFLYGEEIFIFVRHQSYNMSGKSFMFDVALSKLFTFFVRLEVPHAF